MNDGTMITERTELIKALEVAPKKRLLIMEAGDRWTIRELEAFQQHHDDGGLVNLISENIIAEVSPALAASVRNDLAQGLWCSTFVLPSENNPPISAAIDDELPSF